MSVADLRHRALDGDVAALLGEAQIHRPEGERPDRGKVVAAGYKHAEGLQLWGIEVEGRVVAVCGFETAEQGVLLHDLAVAPHSRGRGVGRQLVRFLRERYPNTPIRGYTLQEAEAFYRACGFEVREDGEMPDGRMRLAFELR